MKWITNRKNYILWDARLFILIEKKLWVMKLKLQVPIFLCCDLSNSWKMLLARDYFFCEEATYLAMTAGFVWPWRPYAARNAQNVFFFSNWKHPLLLLVHLLKRVAFIFTHYRSASWRVCPTSVTAINCWHIYLVRVFPWMLHHHLKR